MTGLLDSELNPNLPSCYLVSTDILARILNVPPENVEGELSAESELGGFVISPVFDKNSKTTLGFSGLARLSVLLRKTSIRSYPPKPYINPPTPFVNSLISRWNEYPGVCVHKTASKTYQRICSHLKSLSCGGIHSVGEVSPQFLAKHGIPRDRLTHPWTKDQLIDGIWRLSLLFRNGYWPGDKTRLPRALDTLIYNAYSRTSLLLMVSYCLQYSEPLSEQVKGRTKNPHADITQLYFDRNPALKDLSPHDHQELLNYVEVAIKAYQDLAREIGPRFDWRYPTPKLFITEALNNIQDRWGSLRHLWDCNPEKGNFQNFIVQIKSDMLHE